METLSSVLSRVLPLIVFLPFASSDASCFQRRAGTIVSETANFRKETQEPLTPPKAEEGYLTAPGQADVESPDPLVTVSVYDYSTDLSTEVLATAETKAEHIFAQAGIKTLWLNCFPRKDSGSEDCYVADLHHLTLKILPHAVNQLVRNRQDVLGTALLDKGLGSYAYVFYDRVLELSRERKLGNALLATIMAHEIGHLLLGSNAHSVSGVMCAHWNGDELRRISEGNMGFDSHQSTIMRGRLGAHASVGGDEKIVDPAGISTAR